MSDVTRNFTIKWDADVKDALRGGEAVIASLDGVSKETAKLALSSQDSIKSLVTLTLQSTKSLEEVKSKVIKSLADAGVSGEDVAKAFKISVDSIIDLERKALAEKKKLEAEKRAEAKRTADEEAKIVKEAKAAEADLAAQAAAKLKRIKEQEVAEARFNSEAKLAADKLYASEVSKLWNDVANNEKARQKAITDEFNSELLRRAAIEERVRAASTGFKETISNKQQVLADAEFLATQQVLLAGSTAERIKAIENQKARDIETIYANLYRKLADYEERIRANPERAGSVQGSATRSINAAFTQIGRVTSTSDTATEQLRTIEAFNARIRQAHATALANEIADFRNSRETLQRTLQESLQAEAIVRRYGADSIQAISNASAQNEARIRRELQAELQRIENEVQAGRLRGAATQTATTAAYREAERAITENRNALNGQIETMAHAEASSRSLFERIGLGTIAFRTWNFAINSAVNALRSIPAAGIEMQSTLSALHASFSIDPTGNIGTPNAARGESLSIEAMQMLQKEAERTGIALVTLEKNYRTFLASASLAGESVNTVDKIFKDLNTTVTALHLSGERAELTFLALAQMFNKGKIQSEELVKQLGNLLPGAFASFAAANGISTEKLISQMKSGSVRAHETVQKFIEFYAKGYAGAFELAAVGLNANLGRLDTAWTNFSRTLFMVSQDSMNSVINSFKEFLELLTPTESGLQRLSSALSTMGDGLYALAAVGFVAFLPKIHEAIVATGLFTAALATNPVGLMAIAIAGLTAAIIAYKDTIGTVDYSKLSPKALQGEASKELAELDEKISKLSRNRAGVITDTGALAALNAEKEKVTFAYAAINELRKDLEDEKVKTGQNLDEQLNGAFTALKDKLFHNVKQYNDVVVSLQSQLKTQGGKFAPEGSSGLTETLFNQALDYANDLLFKGADKESKKTEDKAKKDLTAALEERKEILSNYLVFLDKEAKLEIDAENGKIAELDRAYKLGTLSAKEYYTQKEEAIINSNSRQLEIIQQQEAAVEKEIASLRGLTSSTPIEFTIDISKVSKGVNSITEEIEAAAKRWNVSADVIKALVQVESGGNPQAINTAGGGFGAYGALQVRRPALADVTGVKKSEITLNDMKELLEASKGIEAGTHYFAIQLEKSHGDIDKAIRAYKAGFTNVGTGNKEDQASLAYLAAVKSKLGTTLSVNSAIASSDTQTTETQVNNGKRIEELLGKQRELQEKEKLLAQNTTQEFRKNNDDRLLEIKKYQDALATPDEIFAREKAQLLGLKEASTEAEFSTIQLDKSLAELETKRVKANQQRALASLKQVTPFEEYKITFDDKAINDALSRSVALAKDLKDAFGGVGEALGGIIVATDQYAKNLNDIETQQRHARTEAEKQTVLTDDPKQKATIAANLAKLEIQYAEQAKQAELKKYGDITSAAKNFFSVGTSGYKGMEAATRVFRAFEIAQSIQSTLTQQNGIVQTVAAWISGESAKTVATEASAATQIATNTAVGTSTAAVGVATQSLGDPFSAFPRMATMAAIMAGLGFATGFFGGGKSDIDYAKLTQEKTGTGSVLGDTKAKSESISKSIELLARNSSIELPISNAMLTSLKNIEGGINGLAAFGAQQGWFNTKEITKGISTGQLGDGGAESAFGLGTTAISTGIGFASGFGAAALATPGAGIAGGLASGLLGGAASLGIGLAISLILDALGIKAFGRDKSIEDFGITSNIPRTDAEKDKLVPAGRGENFVDLGQTVADISKNKIDLARYIDTKVEETILFFGGSTRYHREGTEQKVGGEVQDQITKLVIGTADSLKTAATYLEPSFTSIEDNINSFVFRLGDISFKGKDGADRAAEDIQKDLNAAFSKNFDGMAQAALKGLEPFQQVGEGYYQTLVRVASGTEQAQAAANALFLGPTVNYKDIVNKQGEVAVEALRDTILKLEKDGDGSFTGLGKIMENFQGTLSEEVTLYRDLIQVRKDLKAVGQKNVDVSTDLIVGAGGLAPLQAGLTDYREKILDPIAQFNSYSQEIQDTFVKIGVAVPETNSQLTALLDSITDPRLKGTVIAQIPNLLKLQELAGNATTARDSVQGFGLSLNETQDLIYKLTGQFGSLDKALEKTSGIIETFTSKADAAETAKGAQEAALKEAPDLKKAGFYAGITQEAANSILQTLGYSSVKALIADFVANGIGEKDPRFKFLQATSDLSVATKTTAQDLLNEATKASEKAANDAAKASKDYAETLTNVNQEIRTLNTSSIGKSLAQINNQIDDFVAKAAASGGTIPNIAELMRLKTLDTLKPLGEELRDIGKSDIQKSIDKVSVWRNEYLASAEEIANKTGMSLAEVRSYINSIADSRYTAAIKGATDSIKTFTTSLSDLIFNVRTTKLGTPAQQFALIEQKAIETYNAAQAGSPKALQALSGQASAYIAALESKYGASSSIAQQKIGEVVNLLEKFPIPTLEDVIQKTSDEQIEAMNLLPTNIANAIEGKPLVVNPVPKTTVESASVAAATASSDTLVAEIRSLKVELQKIKQQQVDQVVALINNDNSNIDRLSTNIDNSIQGGAKAGKKLEVVLA